MSAFYDQASLVVVPSGYKSGKIYAQKPLTTDGQLTFTRASTATRVNASGLIEEVASGVPRLDYLNSSCPKLLLEPQRTNIQTNSEDASSSNWGNPYQLSVTTNQTTAPSGATTADLVADTAFGTPHRFEPNFSATSGQAYTMSCFVKANTLTQCHIFGFADNNVFAGQTAIFDLSAGTVVSNAGNGIPKIESYGNGWYRVSLTLTAGATAVGYFGFGPAKSGSVAYLGDGSSLYMWGIQLEAGAYASSYIPTTTAAVTRLADMSGTTNYFGAQTFAGNFTFFVDLLPMEGNTGISDAMILGGGDFNGGGNFQSYFRFTSDSIILAGVAENNIISRSYTMTANQQYKILVTRTGTTVKIFANGAQVGASATSSTSVILRSLGWSYIQTNYNYDGRINQVLLMPSGLTDAQAIELTTL
jgi:hypothetical protein